MTIQKGLTLSNKEIKKKNENPSLITLALTQIHLMKCRPDSMEMPF